MRPQTNIVRKNSLRKVQQWTFESMARAIKPSVGPFGSTTQIIKTKQIGEYGAPPEYTKDGHTIGKHLMYSGAIEDSLQKEMTDNTQYIVDTVGDGTSSTYLMSSYIFNRLIEKCDKYPAYKVIATMKDIVSKLQDSIMTRSKELDLDAIYDIAMISTNSNVELSRDIRNIYEKFGMNAYISLEASNDENSYVRTFEGLTLEVGSADACYVNNVENGVSTSTISDARIYAFVDPIDTGAMQVFLENIIKANIFLPANSGQPYIPTVIIAPKISLDANNFLDKVQTQLTKYGSNYDAKPPINIVTNFGQEVMPMYLDIIRLCGCPIIKKYINVAVEEKEQQEGTAPTADNIQEFYGQAELVKSDSIKTSFVNPAALVATYEENIYEDGDDEVTTAEYVTAHWGKGEITLELRAAKGTMYTLVEGETVPREDLDDAVAGDQVLADDNIYWTDDTHEDTITETEYLLEACRKLTVVHFKGEIMKNEDGTYKSSDALTNMISYYKEQLEIAKKDGEDADKIGGLIRRIHALESVMVDYIVGGVTITERDATRALADDAIKNIRSAAKFGYGFGTNFEGFRAVTKFYEENEETLTPIEKQVTLAIKDAYNDIQELLYSTVYYPELDVYNEEDEEPNTYEGIARYETAIQEHVRGLIAQSLEEDCPMNFTTLTFDKKVLCSIKQDVEILEVLAKIISIVFTTNQSLLQNPGYNMYIEADDQDLAE